MPYTPEIFNRFNQLVESSRNAVSRHIQYLLKPDDGYPKGSDEKLKELYNVWRADCRAMDAACEENVHLAARSEMLDMPADDEEHFLCRRMAAIIIERYVFGEHNAQRYLPELVEKMKASDCFKHPHTCACHNLKDWTCANNDLLHTLTLHYLEKEEPAEVSVGGGPLSLQPSEGGGATMPIAGATPIARVIPLQRVDKHVENCACGSCYNKRVADGSQDAYMAKLRAETDAILAKASARYAYSTTTEYASTGGFGLNAPPVNLMSSAGRAGDAIYAALKMTGGDTDDGFAKNLFKTVQGVNYDDKCPHGLPFYACMSCSH
jgi:hypothetical protein